MMQRKKHPKQTPRYRFLGEQLRNYLEEPHQGRGQVGYNCAAPGGTLWDECLGEIRGAPRAAPRDLRNASHHNLKYTYTGEPKLNQAANLIMVLVLVRGPCSWASHGFEVEGLFAWKRRQGPIVSCLSRQVEVTDCGQLDYEKAERSQEASMQPVVEHLVEECRHAVGSITR